MTAEKRPDAETPVFETSEVEANRAIENGQGVGARELEAQRDPGGVQTADEDGEGFDEAGRAIRKGAKPDEATSGDI